MKNSHIHDPVVTGVIGFTLITSFLGAILLAFFSTTTFDFLSWSTGYQGAASAYALNFLRLSGLFFIPMILLEIGLLRDLTKSHLDIYLPLKFGLMLVFAFAPYFVGAGWLLEVIIPALMLVYFMLYIVLLYRVYHQALPGVESNVVQDKVSYILCLFVMFFAISYIFLSLVRSEELIAIIYLTPGASTGDVHSLFVLSLSLVGLPWCALILSVLMNFTRERIRFYMLFSWVMLVIAAFTSWFIGANSVFMMMGTLQVLMLLLLYAVVIYRVFYRQ